MATLPYFRWFPADAETDEAYTALTDQERGFFHRCLNRAWVNDGLPCDPVELARVMTVTAGYLTKVWPRVSKMFVPRESDASRVVNPRQEKERANAISKSEHNKRPGNANASRTRFIRDPIDSQHAQARAESVCVSGIKETTLETESFLPPPRAPQMPPSAESSRFLEWLEGYRGRKADLDGAARAWISVGGDAQPEAAFACRNRYNASAEVERGAFMEAGKFIFQQGRNGWRGEWPKARTDPDQPRSIYKRTAIDANGNIVEVQR